MIFVGQWSAAHSNASPPSQDELNYFLKVSLFEPRVDQFINSYIQQHQDRFANLTPELLQEFKDKSRAQLLDEYKKLAPQFFSKKEIHSLGKYFESPIILKWQKFSDTAYANGRDIMQKNIPENKSK